LAVWIPSHPTQTKFTFPLPYFVLAAHASSVSAQGQHPPHPENKWMTVGTAGSAESRAVVPALLVGSNSSNESSGSPAIVSLAKADTKLSLKLRGPCTTAESDRRVQRKMELTTKRSRRRFREETNAIEKPMQFLSARPSYYTRKKKSLYNFSAKNCWLSS